MVFSSSIFIYCFLPLVLLGYYLLKIEYRNAFLLCASLFFYAWGEPKFVFVIIISILINYLFGLLIHFSQQKYSFAINRVVLLTGVAANCGLLFYYKYYDFFLSSINGFTGMNFPLKHIILPIGISFFTFQGLSYVIDLYLKKVPVQKNLIKFGLFKAFFPQLIAGPIVRYVDVHEQIDNRVSTVDKFAYGVRRFVMGLAKKLIIANTLGAVADQIFSLPNDQHSMTIAWVGAICYTFQIYFDFSGYSDMAIGLASMFGFKFRENFEFPYISSSLTEFWRRWHISLSTWFRDYLYIPLGGNRRGNLYVNLMIVFIVTGLWHGAAWNFIIWGLWHGLFLIIERLFKQAKFKIKMPRIIFWIYTMLVVIIGWILFRSPNLAYAIDYLKIMFGLLKASHVGFTVWYYLDYSVLFILLVASVVSLPVSEYLKNKFNHTVNQTGYSLVFLNMFIAILFIICLMYLATTTYNPFIYFRF